VVLHEVYPLGNSFVKAVKSEFALAKVCQAGGNGWLVYPLPVAAGNLGNINFFTTPPHPPPPCLVPSSQLHRYFTAFMPSWIFMESGPVP